MDQDQNRSFLENEIKQQMLMTLEIHNNIWQFPPERMVRMLSPKTLGPRAESSDPCGECEGKGKEMEVEKGGEEVGEKMKEKEKEEKPFELVDVKLKIPRGSFVAIVGRVGSGKVRRSCYMLCLYRDRAPHRRAPCFKHSLER